MVPKKTGGGWTRSIADVGQRKKQQKSKQTHQKYQPKKIRQRK